MQKGAVFTQGMLIWMQFSFNKTFKLKQKDSLPYDLSIMREKTDSCFSKVY